MNDFKIIEVEQGTKDWHLWRHQGIGASEAAKVLKECPYDSPRDLWKEKICKNPNTKTDKNKEFIFRKGHKAEILARNEFQKLTGINIQPMCIESLKVGYHRASLDGFHTKTGTFEAKLLGLDDFKNALNGIIQYHHRIQMNHQFMVTGNVDAGFYYGIYEGKKDENGDFIEEPSGILIPVKPDYELIKEIEEKEHAFWEMVLNNVQPEITERDYLELTDLKDIQVFANLRQLTIDKNKLEEDIKKEKAKVVKMAVAKYGHNKISIPGLTVSRSNGKTGGIDYSQMPPIKRLTEAYLQKYRKPTGKESWTVKVKKVTQTKPASPNEVTKKAAQKIIDAAKKEVV